VLTLGVLGLGCGTIMDPDLDRVQCWTDADCEKLGANFAGATCVESVCEASQAWTCAKHSPAMTTATAPIGIGFSLFDAIARKPIAGVNASLCTKLDVECTSPVTQTQSDVNGVVYVKMMPLFDGYIELKADGYDPALMFLPPSVSSVDLGKYPLASVAATSALGGQLGKAVKSGTSRVLIMTTDCSMQPASGVAVTGENLGEDVIRFYAVGGVPTFTGTSTDSDGVAGFINVIPGPVTIHAELDNGQRVGRVGLFTRPDVVSIRRLQPWTD
jgi:hypothetical protein